MRVVHMTLVFFRNLYIAVMFLPLWIWSAVYRAVPGALNFSTATWGTFCVLALLYGAFGLWFFAERAVKAHYEGKPSRGLNISVWAIAITLFAACLGAVIDQGSNGWGKAMFLIGIVLLPLVLLYSILAMGPIMPKREASKEAGGETSQEIVIEERQ